MTEEIKTEQDDNAQESEQGYIRRNKLKLAMVAAGITITTLNPYVGLPFLVCLAVVSVNPVRSAGIVFNSAVGILFGLQAGVIAKLEFDKKYPSNTSAYIAAKSAITQKLVAYGNGGTYPKPVQDDQGRYTIKADDIKVITTTERDAKTGKEEEEVSVKAQLMGMYQKEHVSFWTLRPYKEVVKIDEPIREIARNVPLGSPILWR